MPERNERGRRRTIGLVLLCPVVSHSNLVLVVEPCLVIFGLRGVENPLAEAPSHGAQVVAERLAAPLVRERHE